MATELDEIDIKILRQLQDQARISNVELADRVGLSRVSDVSGLSSRQA